MPDRPVYYVLPPDAPAASPPVARPSSFARPAAPLARPEPVAAPAPVDAEPALTAPEAPPPPVARPKPTARPGKRPFKLIDIWKRYLPPVRLVWIFLGIFAWVGGGFVNWTRAGPILALPLIGIVADLWFQWVRYPKVRFPDAAITISMFLAVIIWPSEISLALVSIGVATIGLRHLLRRDAHPWFNPAAAGIAVGTFLFGLPTSWHVGVTTWEVGLVLLFGLILIVKAPHTWRIPVFFYAIYLPIEIALALYLHQGGHLSQILLAGPLSAAYLFYVLFMVTEPRTAPTSRKAMPLYGLIVGAAAAGLPILFILYPELGALGIIAPFLALFVGNTFTMVLPSARGSGRSASAAAKNPALPAPVARAERGRAAPVTPLGASGTAGLAPMRSFLRR